MRLKSLVPSAEIAAGRNRGTWMALSFAAGTVNATALLCCQRYVTHVTGTLTRIGLHTMDWELAADYFVVFLCFVLGAMAAVLLLDGRRLRGLPALPWLPLLTVAVILTVCAFAGRAGLFGRFGTDVETEHDFLLLSLLSLAMGLQNASVGNATGSLVRTTHATGPATDLGVALAFLLVRNLPAEHRLAARRTAILRGGKLAAFVVGAAAAAFYVPHLGYLSFFVPAIVCAVVAIAVFGAIPAPERIRARTSLIGE